MLKSTLTLKLFYLINVSLIDIHIHALDEQDIKVIITTDFHLCCIALDQTLCPAHKPWYISCSDILPKCKMKVFFISVSGCVILLNVISVLMHFVEMESNKGFSVTVIAINFNDILCGTYLGCVWVPDLVLKGTFLVKEELWRSGPICFTAFMFILWFTILTQCFLIFLSLSRLMVVIHPINTKFKRAGFACK